MAGFWASSFLNPSAKQLVIIHRGTEKNNLQQLKTDFNLAMNRVTKDEIKKAYWHTSQSLMNNALKEENQKFVKNDFQSQSQAIVLVAG